MKNILANFLDNNCEDSALPKDRLKFMYALIIIIFFIIISRLIFLSVFTKNKSFKLSDVVDKIDRRVTIVDRNGVLIATDIGLVSFYLNRELVTNPQETSEIIHQIIPEISTEKLYHKLTSTTNKAKFILVKRNITPNQQNSIKESGILGFEFNESAGRVYPHKNLFSHVVGYVDTDGNGIAGLEKQYDEYLKDPTNKPLELTLDIRIQSILKQQLAKGLEKYKAKSILGIVSEVKTGNILGIVSLPDFDPNQPYSASKESLYDKATYGVYEMGSIFKLFTVAIALDKNIISKDKIYDVSQTINSASYQIKQENYTKRYLTPEEILAKSSNVGAALIGLDVGTERLRNFLNTLGMFDRVPANFPSLAKPLLPKIWRDINTITISYGHGIAVTPLHVIMAVGGIANDGVLKIPRFVNGEELEDSRIISSETSKTMNLYLREVVRNGTGWRANSLGYSVGGKTGSARLLKNGKYQEGNIMANFVGVFPMNDPHFMIYIMVESPNVPGVKENISGGAIAAPIFARIIESIAPILNVVPYVERIE